MTSITMPVIDRRARTSDGTAICSICQEAIPAGETYQEDICAHRGVTVERNYCLPCLTARDVSDKASWVAVIVMVAVILAVYAAMVTGWPL